MIMKYITKIKANITIYASKKTSNILEGTYNSIYKGKSLNFEDLRNYVIGDNIKDIDWKATARSRNVLIRQYIAEKKHNIMLVLDTGKKMLADTQKLESKKEVALMTAGTIAYLANQNGDYVGAIYNKEDLVSYHPFKSGLFNIETILSNYDKDLQTDSKNNLEYTLNYIGRNIKRRMIIFIITDLDGMDSIKQSTVKGLASVHDVMIINIGDADMTGNMAYDIDNSNYIPKTLLEDTKLHEIEQKIKKQVYTKNVKKFEKYKITTSTINSNEEITLKIIELLERHKNANNR